MNKTKFFSSLLVAVLFATTSVFVSCKDYDDDIKNLQSQIDKAALKADLDALSTKLASAESTANAAKTTAESALAKANANATEIAAVKATAEKAAADAADALKKVATAQSTAEAAQAAADGAKTLAENAQKAADAAQSTANAAQTAANAAQATANAAATKQELADAVKKVEDAAKALSDAAATKTELADAKTELKAYTDAAKAAALETAKAAATAAEKALTDAKGYTDAEVVKINDNIKTLATQAAVEKLSKDLGDEITGLKNTLAAITDEEKMAELVKIVGSFDTIVETLFRAVTSVELIATYSGTLDDADEAIQFPLGHVLDGNEGYDLTFFFGKQNWTDKFGNKEDSIADADQIIEYTEGKDIRAKQAILIRVNPVNATFAKEDVKLIDSKGRDLSGIITIGDPYRYEGLITRGTTTETGLWIVPLSVKENTTLKEFNVVTYNEREYYTEETYKQDNAGATDAQAKKAVEENAIRKPGDPILYAVAINNTADEADGRFVASTYDLGAAYENYTPAVALNFNLEAKDSEGKPIYGTSYPDYTTTVHNRWTSYVSDFEAAGIQSKDQRNAHTLLNPEQKWVASLTDKATAAGYAIPASAAKQSKNKDKDVYDTENDVNDYRYGYDYFTVESVGQPITIELPEYYKKKAEYWYITYDFQANAVESAPSEWEAWQSYKSGIEGIYKMTRGAEKITLNIKAPTAQGDVIGFRVWAVNYDGSLLDPDGKAFYVKVGEIETIKKTLTAEVLALDTIKGMSLDSIYTEDRNFEEVLKRDEHVNWGIAELPDGAFESLSFYSYPYEQIMSGTNVRNSFKLYWALYQKDKKTLATNWNNVKYLVVGVKGQDLKNWLNGSTLNLTTFTKLRSEASKPMQYELELKAKKVMPTAANIPEDYKFVWKPDYDPAVKGALNVYAIATQDSINAERYNPSDKIDSIYWNKRNGTMWDAVSTEDWTKFAKGTSRKIEDYVSGEFLADADAKKLYSFTIPGLPTDIKKKSSWAYNTDWTAATNDKGGNTVVRTLPTVIGNDYSNTLLKFIFKGISATKDNDGWTTNYDYPVVAQTFKTSFKNAVDLLKYTTEYTYPVYKVENGQVVDGDPIQDGTQYVVESRPTDNKLYIQWIADNLTGGDAVTKFRRISSKSTKTFYNTQVALNAALKLNSSDAEIVLARDAKLINTTGTPATVRANYTFSSDIYNINNPKTTGVTEKLTFEFTGNVAKYIEPVTETDLASGFKKKGGANNPTEDMTGTVKITGYDAFGKKHEFEFPVVILYNE